MPAKSPLVIHCLVPEIDQPSPSLTAAVRSEPASEPDVGLGQREGADHLSPGQRRNEALLLLVGAEAEDRQGDRARVHRDGDADPGVGPRELLQDEDVGEEVGARAAQLLRHAHPHQPELAEPAEQLPRKGVRAVPGGGVRLDLGPGELARERLDLALLGRELEVHRGRV